MECRDVRELADSFLSEQLLVETTHEVVRHLETCPQCRADLAERRVMRTKLRDAWTRAEHLSPRPTFAAELTARLRPSDVAAPVSRRSVLQSWWALAAGLVLAAGGGVLVRESRSRSRWAALARAAAGDHQNCAIKFNLAERPIPLAEAGRRYGEPYAALATFEFPATEMAVDLLERHACVYDGRRFGHFVFRSRGSIVSLLITEGPSPAAPTLEHTDVGPAVASLPAGRFVAFVVSDLDGRQVLETARRLSEPLSRHLA